MSVCGFDASILVIDLLISVVVPFIAYRFLLKRIMPGKWAPIIVSVILFVILILITSASAQSCTGPLIGADGRILG